ncbi:MAG TPA: hypothetical protein VFD71_21280 [Planctomycetota bacterium]|nr:hypothetical protein [Planctomycetota bacterium]
MNPSAKRIDPAPAPQSRAPQPALSHPQLLSLLELFPEDALNLSRFEEVGPAEVPEPYRRLLVHRHHMTVTLEEHHNSPVTLEVLVRRRRGDDYARRLVLRAGSEQKIVLLGIMRFHLQHTKEEVRNAIIEEKTPLGRILIENNVLRWIEPHSYWRLHLDDELRRIFGVQKAAVTYGRVAFIICHNSPAVQLLEIVAPESD